MNLRKVFKPQIIQDWTKLLREKGFKGFVREKGWKVVIAIFLFYLVRDTILYGPAFYLLLQGFVCGK